VCAQGGRSPCSSILSAPATESVNRLQSRESERSQRSNAPGSLGPEHDHILGRSLRPSFSRTTSSGRGSESASHSLSEPQVERPKAARTSGHPGAGQPQPSPAALARTGHPPAMSPCAQNSSSRFGRSLRPSFWRTTASGRGSESASHSVSEPRVERPKAARTSGHPGTGHGHRPTTIGRPQRFPTYDQPPRGTARPALAAPSGRRSRERRPPVAAPNPHLTPFQSREWSGRRPRERAVTPELANRNRPPQRSPAPATRLR
jgi:hypothetical protein